MFSFARDVATPETSSSRYGSQALSGQLWGILLSPFHVDGGSEAVGGDVGLGQDSSEKDCKKDIWSIAKLKYLGRHLNRRLCLTNHLDNHILKLDQQVTLAHHVFRLYSSRRLAFSLASRVTTLPTATNPDAHMIPLGKL